MITRGSAQDHIILKSMQFYSYHGVNPEERTLGQTFEVDLDVELDLRVAGMSDRAEDTVSYTTLYRQVDQVMSGPSKNLLEAIAESISQEVLNSKSIKAVRVSVQKIRPPIKGAFLASAGVVIYREQA